MQVRRHSAALNYQALRGYADGRKAQEFQNRAISTLLNFYKAAGSGRSYQFPSGTQKDIAGLFGFEPLHRHSAFL